MDEYAAQGFVRFLKGMIMNYGGHSRKFRETYRSFSGMRLRCYCPWLRAYPNYGARGITVCDRWLHSFKNFIDDMGIRPEGMTLDRIDNNGNYEPGNCRWATHFEQNNNTRANRRIEVFGETLTAAEIARKFNIPYATVYVWVSRYGRQAVEGRISKHRPTKTRRVA